MTRRRDDTLEDRARHESDDAGFGNSGFGSSGFGKSIRDRSGPDRVKFGRSGSGRNDGGKPDRDRSSFGHGGDGRARNEGGFCSKRDRDNQSRRPYTGDLGQSNDNDGFEFGNGSDGKRDGFSGRARDDSGFGLKRDSNDSNNNGGFGNSGFGGGGSSFGGAQRFKGRKDGGGDGFRSVGGAGGYRGPSNRRDDAKGADQRFGCRNGAGLRFGDKTNADGGDNDFRRNFHRRRNFNDKDDADSGDDRSSSRRRDESKPVMQLLDPTRVPRGGRYFEHDSRDDGGRLDEDYRLDGRQLTSFVCRMYDPRAGDRPPKRAAPTGWRNQSFGFGVRDDSKRSRSGGYRDQDYCSGGSTVADSSWRSDAGDVNGVWKHDKFEELAREELKTEFPTK